MTQKFFKMDRKVARKIGVLFFAIAVSSWSAKAQTTFRVGGITYEITAGSTVKVIFNDTVAYSGNVIIPDTVQYTSIKYAVTAIGEGAFSGNESLKTVSIPVSVTSIGEYAFTGCDSLNAITVASANTAFLSLSGVLYSKDTTRLLQYPIGASAISYTIHDSVRVIGKAAFAFDTKLTHIIMPDGLRTIEEEAFLECIALVDADIPDKDTLIGSAAFSGCVALKTIYIGKAVKTIGNYAFTDCDSVITITVDPANLYYVDVSGVLFTKDTTLLIMYPIGRTSTTYTIPSQVVRVGDNAFANCRYIATIYFGGNLVTRIGTNAFRECINLRRVGASGFPASLQAIENNAFQGCRSLDTISLGSAIVAIGGNAFSECTALRNIVVNASNPRYAASNGVLFTKNIDTLLLYPAGRTNTSYQIPASVKRIEDAALAYCRYLQTLTIDSNVISMGEGVFYMDTNLTQMTVKAKTVPQATGSTFLSTPNTIPIYVTCGLESNYMSDPFWNYFTGITSVQAYTFAANSSNTAFGNVYVTQVPTCLNNNTAIATAYPESGYGFQKWNDNDTTNPRTIALTANTAITATFAKLYYISVLSSSIYGVTDGTGAYLNGSTAVLQANASSGYRFSQWNDGNTQNPRTITVTRDSTFTATFIVGYTATVLSNDTNWGTVSGDGGYVQNQSVIIQAYPKGQNTFVQWSDGNTQNPRTFTITKDTAFTAIFVGVYTLTANSDNISQGTVAGGGNYQYQTQALMTASANTGYQFREWNDYNTQNPRTVTLTSDTSFTAYFDKTYTLAVAANDIVRGFVIGGGTFVENTSQIIRAYPYQGFVFRQWSDGDTTNPRTVSMNSDKNYTAMFLQARIVQIAVNNSSMGTVNTAPIIVNNTLMNGDTVNLTAMPAGGHRFLRWGDDTNLTNPTRQVVITQDTVITAVFIALHQLNVASANLIMGSVSGSGTFDYGSRCSFSAVANTGYRFYRWTDGNTQNPRTITLMRDTLFTAEFVATCQITLLVNDTTMGTTYGSGSYDNGSTATLQAIAKAGHRFVQWQDGDTTNPRTHIVSGSANFTAIFIETYRLSVEILPNPTTGEVVCNAVYDKNAVATLTAIPKYGYRFVKWADDTLSNPRYVTVTQDTNLQAIFVAIYHITVWANDDLRGSVSGEGDYDKDATAVITAQANSGYRFARWNDGDTANPRTIVVTQNKLYTAMFAQSRHITVNVDNATKGSASGSGDYDQDSTAVIEATAHIGYRFSHWNDGNTDNPREVLVTGDQTFTAVFKDLFKVETYSNDTTMGYVTGDGYYDMDEVANLVAVANSGYRFVAWTDSVTQNPRSIAVTGNMSFTAIFELKTEDPDPNSIKEAQEDVRMRIYPNPANGQFTISLPNPSKGGANEAENVEMYDIEGRLVLQSKIVNLQSKIILDVSHLANGTYFVKINKTVKKVIINNQ